MTDNKYDKAAEIPPNGFADAVEMLVNNINEYTTIKNKDDAVDNYKRREDIKEEISHLIKVAPAQDGVKHFSKSDSVTALDMIRCDHILLVKTVKELSDAVQTLRVDNTHLRADIATLTIRANNHVLSIQHLSDNKANKWFKGEME